DKGGYDHRIQAGSTAETVFLESAFPRIAHPGDHETRQHKEDENGGSPTIELPEQTPAYPRSGVVRHENRKRRAEAQRVEIKRKCAGHRAATMTCLGLRRFWVRRARVVVRRDPPPCRFRSTRHARSFAGRGPSPAGPGAAIPLRRSGPSGKSGQARRTAQSHLSEARRPRATVACGNTR